MELLSLLILSVVGGYALSTTWKASLYRSARESGHRLYFRAVFYATFLIVCAGFLHILFYLHLPAYQMLISMERFALGLPQCSNCMFGNGEKVAIVLMSFMLGPLLGHLLNITRAPFVREWRIFEAWERRLLARAIENNDFEKLIARSVYENKPIIFTLESGKVYVGWAVRAPNPSELRKAVRILPLLSGFRHPHDQTVAFTTDYLDVLEQLEQDDEFMNHLNATDFEIVIPSDQICSSHFFDLEAYTHLAEASQRQQAGKTKGAAQLK